MSCSDGVGVAKAKVASRETAKTKVLNCIVMVCRAGLMIEAWLVYKLEWVSGREE